MTKWQKYSALPIYRGLFPPKNSRKTPIARPLGRGMVVSREFLVWPQFYLRIYYAMCSIVLYCTAIYRESIVWQVNEGNISDMSLLSINTFFSKQDIVKLHNFMFHYLICICNLYDGVKRPPGGCFAPFGGSFTSEVGQNAHFCGKMCICRITGTLENVELFMYDRLAPFSGRPSAGGVTNKPESIYMIYIYICLTHWCPRHT